MTLRGCTWILLVAASCALALGCGTSSSDDDGSDGTSGGGTSGGGTFGVGGAVNGGSAGDLQGGSGGSTSGGSAGSTSGGSAGSASGGSAGTASGGTSNGGTTGGSAGSGGSAGTVDCSGTFGDPTPVLPGADTTLGSLTLSADEHELIYVSVSSASPGSTSTFLRTTRANRQTAFAPGTPVSELDAACDSMLIRSGELSADGLRFYFVCYENLSEPTELIRAERPAPGGPFSIESTRFGLVNSGPSLSGDELYLVTSPTESGGQPVLAHERSNVNEAFGAPAPLAGLEMLTPSLSRDGLVVFGVSGNARALVMAERSSVSSPFSAPTTLRSKEAGGRFGSPAISQDCRSLYYVDIAEGASGADEQSVQVLMR